MEKRQGKDEFVKEAREELKKLHNLDFEDFRDAMIGFSEQLLAVQMMMVEDLCLGRKELEAFVTKGTKHVYEQNAKDFKLAEKNFNKIRKELDAMHDSNGKCEAGVMFVLMRMTAVMVSLFKKGLLSKNQVDTSQDLKLVPPPMFKFISDLFGCSQKSLKQLISRAITENA